MKSLLLLSGLAAICQSAAVPQPQPQVLGSPSRTVQESPTPPWWNWWPTETATEPRITSLPRDAAPEPAPQALGPPSRTVLESPTPPIPWWWNQWPTATRVSSSPRDAAPEPQGLGSPSRTAQELPTPPVPWWWNQWPSATSVVTVDREEDEKREPQTLNFGSRSKHTFNIVFSNTGTNLSQLLRLDHNPLSLPGLLPIFQDTSIPLLPMRLTKQ